MTLLALALVVVGLGIAVRGVRRHADGLRRRPTDPRLGYALMRAGRSVLTGLATVAAGIGLALDVPWLFWVALAIGAEELLETSVVVAALDATGRGTLRAAR